jgi:hypothetical protein
MNPDGSINWIYVMLTLGIRFVGVFIVLAILQMGLHLSAKLIAAIVKSSGQSTDKTG